MTDRRTGAKALVEGLVTQDVRHVFGIPGVHNLAIYDALLAQAAAHLPPAHVLVRHEQSAVYAADGYARATGRPGIAVVTTGPGALNAMAALNEAACSDVPVLLIASQIHSGLIGAGRQALHEMKDQVGAFRAVVEHAESVSSVAEIPSRVQQAFSRMRAGPGRATYLEIPHDLLNTECRAETLPPASVPPVHPSAETMRAAINAIRSSEYPALLVGSGVLQARAERTLLRVTEWLGAPVITSSAAKGAIPGDHPLHVGVLAAGGSVDQILGNADLVIAIGTRMAHRDLRRLKAPSPRALVHVDTNPAVFGRTWRPTLTVEADAGAFLEDLFSELALAPARDGQAAQQRIRELNHLQRTRNREREPLAMDFLAAIAEGVGNEGILAVDQTVPGYWAELYYPCRMPRSFLYPSGSGVLGYAIPAALGARTAIPDAKVAVVIGDGGFHFTGAEFGTMVQHRLGIPVLVFNDNQYGVIRTLQMRGFNQSGEVDLTNPDFPALARSYGGEGLRIPNAASLPRAMQKAFERDVPTLIEIPVSFYPPW
ncbi:MAG: thiamine pyrophosphate-binding protein [Myxococcota bacterium]